MMKLLLLLLATAQASDPPAFLLNGRVRVDPPATCSFSEKDPTQFAKDCYGKCAGGKPLSSSVLKSCGSAAISNHKGDKTNVGPGCPISGLFDLNGMCCLSCVAACASEPASFSPAVGYALSSIAFLIVIMGSVWAFGSQAIERLKEDATSMGEYVKGLPAEEMDKLKQKVVDAAATVQEQIDDDEKMIKEGAKDMAYVAMKDGVTGGDVAGDTKKKGCGMIDNILKQVVGDADAINDAAHNLPQMGAEELDNIKEKLVGKLEDTRAWSLFNIGRFLVAEVAILVALLTPPPCLAGLKAACTDGTLCCFPVLLHDVKVFAGYLGVIVNLGSASTQRSAHQTRAPQLCHDSHPPTCPPPATLNRR